jgi:NAD(P)H-flavin reductase
MFNPYQIQKVKILNIEKEAYNINHYKLSFINKRLQEKFEFLPGQILELSIVGFNEAPFAYASSPDQKKYFEICVRRVGSLTSKLHELEKGDILGVRGPYGNGFPIAEIKKRNTLIVAGGIGLIPFRSLIHFICNHKDKFNKQIQLFYGARAEDELLFKKEYKDWCKNIDFHITLDRGKPQKISGLFCDIGLITTLFDKVKMIPNSIALVCGPPIMCKFVIQKLKGLGFADKDIYLSLERRMECGLGICEHCAVGSYFVCKDGPVFTWEQLKGIQGAI